MSKREKVIKRAAEMIAELGVKSLRVDDLASELGISKRTLYEMFSDKEELLYHSIKHLFQSEAAEIQTTISFEQAGIPALFETFDAMMARSAVRKRLMENLAKFPFCFGNLYIKTIVSPLKVSLLTIIICIYFSSVNYHKYTK